MKDTDGTIKGHAVTWTGEEPPTYRAVWSDDPEVTVFEKVPAPQQSETGTNAREAMKKPKQSDYTKDIGTGGTYANHKRPTD